jgi:deoxyribose-phosphate aldolase
MNSNQMNNKNTAIDNHEANQDKKVISYITADIKDHLNSKRNPGMDFQLDKISSIFINRSAIERRCKNYGVRRSIKKDKQAAWLLKAITLIDLTTSKRLIRQAIHVKRNRLPNN